MIEIEGPDGVIYEFPQGTDDGVIRSAMQRVYGQPAASQQETVEVGGMTVPSWMAQQTDDFIQRSAESERDAAAMLNRAGESMTFGLVGDEAAAAFDTAIGRGDGYDERLSHYRQMENDLSGGQRLAADLGGAVVPAVAGAGLIGQFGNWGARALAGAGIGGASGATYGFMEGEGGAENRKDAALTQGLLGALLGGAIPTVGAGVRSIAARRATNRALDQATAGARTSKELLDEGRTAYQAIDDADVQITPEAFDRLRSQAVDRLRNNTGYDELPGAGVTPRTARVVQTMDEAATRMADDPTSALPFRSLDQTRRRAQSAAQDYTNRTEQQAGTTLIKEIDDFVQTLGPDDVAGGDVNTLKNAIGKAREVWSQARRTEMIDNAIDQSGNYLSGGASGVRNQLARILRNPKLSSGFTDAERQALRRVINGNFLEQAVHMAGGRLGQTVATGLSAGIGGATTGLAGGILGTLAGAAISGGARNASNAIAMRGIDRARDIIASGALRDPAVLQALTNSGARPELLTNTGLLGALMAGQSATP